VWARAVGAGASSVRSCARTPDGQERWRHSRPTVRNDGATRARRSGAAPKAPDGQPGRATAADARRRRCCLVRGEKKETHKEKEKAQNETGKEAKQRRKRKRK